MMRATTIRERLGDPSPVVGGKQLDHLDPHARAFIAASPMAILASADASGACDCTPRGDPPGFTAVLDEYTLLLPERKGNKRADTMVNIAETGQIGILFLVPGVTETLRINGHATVIDDAARLAPLAVKRRAPDLGLLVYVEEVFFHCARAFLRSSLWDPATWPAERPTPSLGRVLADQSGGRVDAAALDAELIEDNKNLY